MNLYKILMDDDMVKTIESNYKLCLKLYDIQKCDALAHNPRMLEKRIKYLKKIKKKLLTKK